VLEILAEGSGTVDVFVRGELDMEGAPRFRAAVNGLLNRGDVVDIKLDLTAVELLDATGAGTLIVAHRIAINLRVGLRLCAVSAPAAKVLALVGAADLVPSGSRSNADASGRAGLRTAAPAPVPEG
jgi:anti-sigma B factor antagonist